MPGFTAINARTAEASAPVADAAPEAAVSGQRKATKRRQPPRKKPAAQKNVGQVAADATAPERISGKGKKRASHPGDEPEPKRRKSGSLKSSMPTTKTAVSATTTADPDGNLSAKGASSSSTDAGLVSLTSMAKLNGFRYTRSQAAASGGGEPQSIKSTSISHVPETSMSSVSEACSLGAHERSPILKCVRDLCCPGTYPRTFFMTLGLSLRLTTSLATSHVATDDHASRTKLIERHLTSLLELCNLAIDHSRRHAHSSVCRPNSYTHARFRSPDHYTVFSRTALHASGFRRPARG